MPITARKLFRLSWVSLLLCHEVLETVCHTLIRYIRWVITVRVQIACRKVMLLGRSKWESGEGLPRLSDTLEKWAGRFPG